MKQVFLCIARGLSALHTADLCHLLPPAGGRAAGARPSLAASDGVLAPPTARRLDGWFTQPSCLHPTPHMKPAEICFWVINSPVTITAIINKTTLLTSQPQEVERNHRKTLWSWVFVRFCTELFPYRTGVLEFFSRKSHFWPGTEEKSVWSLNEMNQWKAPDQNCNCFL